MVVDLDGQFLTQREIPELCLFNARVHEKSLILSHDDYSEDHPVFIDPVSFPGEKKIKIWSRTHNVKVAQKDTNSWISDLLRRNVQLAMALPGGYQKFNSKGKWNITFPDAYPLSVIGTESIRELNDRSGIEFSIDRFRPNLLLKTRIAHEEDQWQNIICNHLNFQRVKNIPRCRIVATDQRSGELGKEPLTTLHKYRNFGNQICFGIYVATDQDGQIHVGQKYTVN